MWGEICEGFKGTCKGRVTRMNNGGERGNDRHEEQLKVGQASGSEVLMSKNVAVGLSGE